VVTSCFSSHSFWKAGSLRKGVPERVELKKDRRNAAKPNSYFAGLATRCAIDSRIRRISGSVGARLVA
jgi:hypothetical protein